MPQTSSSEIQKPKIIKLNRDILWRVISLNVGAAGYWDDITTLRRTSQVCSSWRDLVLSSSSLWGRAVNLAMLGLASEEWVQEVIRRTGRAPLHIQDFCDIGVVRFDARSRRAKAITILEDLFKHHWKRVKSVILVVIRLDFSQDPAFEEFLQQPAPCLEVFCVCISNPNTTLRLFGDEAPSLKECELSHIAFNMEALWLPNLRKLHSCPNFSTKQRRERIMTPNQFLDALARMPFLETLHGLDEYTLNLPDGSLSLPNIALPRLTSIEVRPNSTDNARACIAVLSHIIPAPGCNFQAIFLRLTRGFNFTAEEIIAFYALVSQYFENYLKTNPISEFSINFNNRMQIFKMEAGSGDFYLSLNLVSPTLFAKSFFSDENLLHFLFLLNDVEDLNITHHMLPFFLRLRNDDDSIILPRLRRLYLPAGEIYELVEFNHIFLFLEWRWEIGLRLDNIHLPIPTGRPGTHYHDYDLTGLDKFTGLEVEWDGAGRYLCGSGSPDQLIFSASTRL